MAAALNLACAPGVRAEPIDPIAFELYLKARRLDSEWNLPQIGLFEQATELFDRDLERWPNAYFLNTNALRFAIGAAD